MFFANLGINFFMQGLGQQQARDIPPGDEWACCEKIVNELWRNSLRFEDHQKGLMKDLEKTYAIIFRQTESWADVQGMFQSLLLSDDISVDVKEWAAAYDHKINLLRLKNKELHDCLKELDAASNTLYEEENRKIKNAPVDGKNDIEKLKLTKKEFEDEDAPGGGKNDIEKLKLTKKEFEDEDAPGGGKNDIEKLKLTKKEFEDEDAPGGGKNDIEKLKLTKKEFEDKINKLKLAIKCMLTSIYSNLEANKKKIGNNSTSYSHIVNFVLDNFRKLMVFTDWNDVPMDQKGLFVQIRIPSTLDKDIIVTCLNNATKAIYLVKEIDMQAKPLPYEGVDDHKKIQPKEIELRDQFFAPLPHPLTEDRNSLLKNS